MARNELIYHSILKHVYGLPPDWIRRLGRPDRVEPQRRDPSQKASLYSRRRVEAYLEAHLTEYLAMLVARAKRSRQAAAAPCRGVRALIAWAQAVEITVDPLPVRLDRLLQEAEASFLASPAAGEGRYRASYKAVVAHLRHTRTNYHELLAQLGRDPGTAVAYLILKRRVNRKLEALLRQRYGRVVRFVGQEVQDGN